MVERSCQVLGALRAEICRVVQADVDVEPLVVTLSKDRLLHWLNKLNIETNDDLMYVALERYNCEEGKSVSLSTAESCLLFLCECAATGNKRLSDMEEFQLQLNHVIVQSRVDEEFADYRKDVPHDIAAGLSEQELRARWAESRYYGVVAVSKVANFVRVNELVLSPSMTTFNEANYLASFVSMQFAADMRKLPTWILNDDALKKDLHMVWTEQIATSAELEGRAHWDVAKHLPQICVLDSQDGAQRQAAIRSFLQCRAEHVTELKEQLSAAWQRRQATLPNYVLDATIHDLYAVFVTENALPILHRVLCSNE